jgi:hypothetical protein
MQTIFPRLQPENVTITYERKNNLGFNEPRGLPMEVTVSIVSTANAPMTSQYFFVPGLLNFFGIGINPTPGIPQYSTTLVSEDMYGWCKNPNDCAP